MTMRGRLTAEVKLTTGMIAHEQTVRKGISVAIADLFDSLIQDVESVTKLPKPLRWIGVFLQYQRVRSFRVRYLLSPCRRPILFTV